MTDHITVANLNVEKRMRMPKPMPMRIRVPMPMPKANPNGMRGNQHCSLCVHLSLPAVSVILKQVLWKLRGLARASCSGDHEHPIFVEQFQKTFSHFVHWQVRERLFVTTTPTAAAASVGFGFGIGIGIATHGTGTGWIRAYKRKRNGLQSKIEPLDFFVYLLFLSPLWGLVARSQLKRAN